MSLLVWNNPKEKPKEKNSCNYTSDGNLGSDLRHNCFENFLRHVSNERTFGQCQNTNDSNIHAKSMRVKYITARGCRSSPSSALLIRIQIF